MAAKRFRTAAERSASARPGGIATRTKYGAAHYRYLRTLGGPRSRPNPTFEQIAATPRGRRLASRIADSLSGPQPTTKEARITATNKSAADLAHGNAPADSRGASTNQKD